MEDSRTAQDRCREETRVACQRGLGRLNPKGASWALLTQQTSQRRPQTSRLW
jgi:hypothetical protein